MPLGQRGKQRGAVAIIVAIALVALVGAVGLALDLGKLYVAKSELQNGADACALAAARDLTGATPLAVSEAAGITAGSRNMALFQHEPVNFIVDQSVTYSDSLSDPFLDKDSVTYSLASIKYVKCSVQRSGIATWLIQVLNALPGSNIGPNTVSAYAVATTGSAQTTCAIPVFICQPSTISPPQPAYQKGQWLTAKLDSQNNGTYGGGNFGWANLTPGNNGTPALANQLDGAGQCNLPAVGTNIGTTGNKNSLNDDWNSRFGIVKNKVLGVTDFTGFAYTDKTWPAINGSAIRNAYDGSNSVTGQPNFLAARKSYLAYQGDSTTGLTTQGSAANTVYKSGADRRLVLAPVVDCTGFASNGTHQAPVQSWACMLMVNPMSNGGNIDTVALEYRGASNDPTSPCATQGIPGAGTGVGPLVPVLVQ